MKNNEKLQYELEDALISLDRLKARDTLKVASAMYAPIQLADELLTPVLERIGVKWEHGEVALSQVYMSSKICEEFAVDFFTAEVSNRKKQPKMAIAVLQDYHLLGKKIVCSVLKSVGFELINYGEGISVDELVSRVMEDDVKVLLISVLMLPSALRIKEVKKMLGEEGYDAKIVVGGAPFRFDAQLWEEVGADAMGRNAMEATKIINDITGVMS